MTSITKILPAELIDRVINIIADDDNNDKSQYQFELRNVKAFFLTCRTLARYCRRRLYRSVRLFESDKSYESRRQFGRPHPSLARSFANLITNKPEIADYVRELVFYLELDDSLTHQSALSALEGLKKLQKLSIQPDGGYMSWPDFIRSDSWTVVSGLMRCPTVTAVEINRADMFCISDLVSCMDLKSLTLNYCPKPEDNSASLPPFPSKSIKLRDLKIWPYPMEGTNIFKLAYTDGTPILDSSEVRKVTVLVVDDYDDKVQNFAKFLNFMTNMEELNLQVLPQNLQGQGAPEFIPRLLSTPLKTLKVLSLDITVDNHMPDRTGIAHLLENLSSENRIEKFSFCIYYFYDPSEPSDLSWDTLKERVLALKWPALTRVDLRLSIRTTSAVQLHGPVTFLRPSPARSFVEVE